MNLPDDKKSPDKLPPVEACEVYNLLVECSHESLITSGLRERLQDMMAHMRRIKRMREGEDFRDWVDSIACSCGHGRHVHKKDFSQFYQWFNSCESCDCKAWDHEEGDPYL